MNHRQYEDYVAQVVEGLSISKNAEIYRNRRYPGVRQPGRYEIDVSCEVHVDNALSLLIIVECKNWKRPVDRPQFQKLVQTRDAISAHKAAFASPVGYTEEAIDVAKANGVALWVVANGVFDVAAGGGAAGLLLALKASNKLRTYIYGLLQYTGNYYGNLTYSWQQAWYSEGRSGGRIDPLLIDPKRQNLVPVSWSQAAKGFPSTYRAVSPFASSRDPIMALLVAHVLYSLNVGGVVVDKIASRILTYRSVFVKAGMSSSMAQDYTDEVVRMVTSDPIFPFGSWEDLIAFDSRLDHSNTELLIPADWIEQYGSDFHIYARSDVQPFLHLSNNVVWANAAWMLGSRGLLSKGAGFRWPETK